jgi:hypothetical protein
MVSETTPMVLAEGHGHTMALDQFALLEVLEVLRAAEVDDRIPQAAETIYQLEIRPGPVPGAPMVAQIRWQKPADGSEATAIAQIRWHRTLALITSPLCW